MMNQSGEFSEIGSADKKRKVFILGSAVLDLNAGEIPDRNRWLEKQRIDHIKIQAGGDALNQATHLASLGYDAVLISAVGGESRGEIPEREAKVSADGFRGSPLRQTGETGEMDANGAILRQMAESRGINTRRLTVKPDSATGTSLVLVGDSGERNTFSVGGAYGELTAEDLPELDGSEAGISIASFFQMPLLEAEGLLAWLQVAEEKGIPVFADLGSDKRHQGLPGIAPFLPYLHTFLPSLEDAQRMTGAERPEEAAEVFLRAGARRVVIKCGAEGCYYILNREATLCGERLPEKKTGMVSPCGEMPSGTETCSVRRQENMLPEDACGWIPADAVNPVDTTGAGDCFVAVYIDGILSGDSVKTACERAAAAASRSTQVVGASEMPAAGLMGKLYR